jgi:hypothetical protein
MKTLLYGLEPKYRILNILALLVLSSSFLPLVFNNLPSFIRSEHLYIILWSFTLIFAFPKALSNKMFLQFLIYYSVLYFLLYYFSQHVSDWNRNFIRNELYIFSVSLSIFGYFYERRDIESLARISKLIFYFIVITAIMSIVTSFFSPTYARDINTIETAEKVVAYSFLGSGTYGFFQAILLLIPILAYYYKNNENFFLNKRSILLIVLIVSLAVLRSQFFANIILLFPLLLLSFIGKRRRYLYASLVAIFSIVFILLLNENLPKYISSISGYFDNESVMYDKLNDTREFFEEGANLESANTGISARALRYKYLKESFLSNIFIGGEYWNGHLYWMNKIGSFGLVGFVPFLLIFLGYIRFMARIYNVNFRYYFFVSVFALVALGLMKNITGRTLWYTYFIIIPGLYFIQYYDQVSRKTRKRKIIRI